MKDQPKTKQARSESERRKVEQALKESEERYWAILESIQEGYYEVDLAGNYTFYNPSMSKMLGYTREEMMGMNFRQYMDKKNVKKILRDFNEVYRTGISSRVVDYEQIKKDGSKMFVETSVALMRDSSGQPTGFRGIVRDISERRRIENALRLSEERYRTVLDDMEEGYQEVDLAGNFTFFNEAFLKIFGYSAEEMMGKNYSLYAADEEISKKVYRTYNRMYKTGIPLKSFEWDIIRKDGARRTIEFFASILRDSDDRPVGFRGIVRDVTDRRRVEQALKESEKKYHNIFDNALEGIYQTTPEGKFITANQAMATILGCDSPQELITTITDIPNQLYVHSEERSKILQVAQERGFLSGYEVQFYRKDGSIIWVTVNMRSVRDQDGNLLYYEGLIVDITERKQAEEERKKLILELREALSQVKTLSGLLPICASCKKIRDDKGYWNQIEAYLTTHSDVEFSHGICPECTKRLYSDIYENKHKID